MMDEQIEQFRVELASRLTSPSFTPFVAWTDRGRPLPVLDRATALVSADGHALVADVGDGVLVRLPLATIDELRDLIPMETPNRSLWLVINHLEHARPGTASREILAMLDATPEAELEGELGPRDEVAWAVIWRAAWRLGVAEAKPATATGSTTGWRTPA